MPMNLFSPLTLGDFSLSNRIVMAPMTRSRADAQGVPSPLAAEYYASRADAGLLITEGTGPERGRNGLRANPRDLYSSPDRNMAHGDRCRTRTRRQDFSPDHARRQDRAFSESYDSRIRRLRLRRFAQTDRCGRIRRECNPTSCLVSCSWPRSRPCIDEFAQATRNAIEAGFDGVELHAASGYLPNQFLSPSSNQRSDLYGGSIENRIRFVIETLGAMIAAAGSPGKVGIKVSPGMKLNSIQDDDPLPTLCDAGQGHRSASSCVPACDANGNWRGSLSPRGFCRNAARRRRFRESGSESDVRGRPRRCHRLWRFLPRQSGSSEAF